jgi:hypothetical protein
MMAHHRRDRWFGKRKKIKFSFLVSFGLFSKKLKVMIIKEKKGENKVSLTSPPRCVKAKKIIIIRDIWQRASFTIAGLSGKYLTKKKREERGWWTCGVSRTAPRWISLQKTRRTHHHHQPQFFFFLILNK